MDPFHPAGSFVNLPNARTPVSDRRHEHDLRLPLDAERRFFRERQLTDRRLLPPDDRRVQRSGRYGTKVGEVEFDLANFLGSNHHIINDLADGWI